MVEVNVGGGKGGGAGAHLGSTPPDSTEELWIYTGGTSNTYGKGNTALVKGGLYYNEGQDVTKNWEPTVTLWG